MKINFELDCSHEQFVNILALMGVPAVATIGGDIQVKVDVPTEEPAKPAKEKKGKKKADEAKPEEPAKPDEPTKPAAGLTLEEVRAHIIKACEVIGTAEGLNVVEKAAGVRKAAQIDPAKFGAVITALDAAVVKHNEIG